MKQGWEIKKLGEVCEILDHLRVPITKKDRREGCYPYYGASGVQDYIDSYIFDGRYLLVGEDGAKWGPNDKSAYIIEGKSWVNNHAHILKINDCLSDKLVEYYLVAKDLQEFITGAIVPKLTQQALRNIPIPVPPLPIQEQIVSELDLLSGIIEKKREQLKELDALAQSIFYDMFGDPITNEKGWEVKKLKDVCIKLFAGGDVPKENYSETCTEEYNIPIYSNGIGDNALYGYTCIKKVEDVSITISGRGTIGYCEVRKAPFYPIIRLIVATPLTSTVLPIILKYIIDNLDLKSTGGAIPQLTIPMIKDRFIPIPPLPLQHQFATKIEAIEKQKELIKQSISETETLFNARMQEHFG